MIKKISTILLNREFLFLLFLFVISFSLRFYLLPQNLFFGPEQGIDFLEIKKIVVDYNPTLVGSKTDIAGVFHGPIYYYLSTIPFFLSNGNPLFISAFLVFLNCLTVFFLYILGKELVNKQVGIFASLLFTVSFGAIIYSRWLSNIPLVIPLSALFFLFLNRFLKDTGKKKNVWNLLFVAILYGLLGQAEFLNFIFFGIILLFTVIIFRKQFLSVRKRYLALAGFTLLLFSASTYILFDLTHDHILGKSLMQLISGEKGYYVSFAKVITLSFEVFLESVVMYVTPFYSWFALIVVGASTYVVIRNKKNNKRLIIMVLWVFITPVILVTLRHDVLQQFFVGSLCGIILLTSILIEAVFKKNKKLGYIFLYGLLYINVYAWYINIPKNTNIFFQSTQPNLKYSDQLKVIDTIYKREKGKDFSFQSYTIPAWSQQGWEYLFWQRGLQKYGYLPRLVNGKTLYVIVQDDPSSKFFQDAWLKHTVTKWGKYDSSFRHGVLTVQVLKID